MPPLNPQAAKGKKERRRFAFSLLGLAGSSYVDPLMAADKRPYSQTINELEVALD